MLPHRETTLDDLIKKLAFDGDFGCRWGYILRILGVYIVHTVNV